MPDRRSSKPSAPKPEVPWLKDRPDLHRTDEESDVLEQPSDGSNEPGDQRVPGSERRDPQPRAPGTQGDATKARRRPS